MPQGFSLSNFKAALFDVDGTLVDSTDVIVRSLGDTYERYVGIRPGNDKIRALIGMPLQSQLRLFQSTPPSDDRLSEMISFAIGRFESNKSLETTFDASVEVLRMCHRSGIKTALVTSKNAVELELFLQRFPGADAVDETVCASDVHQPKPNAESAILACRKLGVAPHETVMIGDTVYDMRCARDAGVAPVAVGFGASTIESLLAETPAAFFETPELLLEWARESLLEYSCQERS